MEVHHHAVTSRKTWTHYLWEFLMLFLAVFCGFLAENLREHQVERQREKQYIRSLIADLKTDQQVLAEHMSHLKKGLAMMDSVIRFLDTPTLISNHSGELY